MGDWSDLLPRAGQGSGIPEFALAALNAQSARAQNDAQTQLIGQQIGQAQRQATRQQSFQADVSNYLAITDPKKQSNALAALIAKYPEQKDALAKSWGVTDEAKKSADLGWMGETVAAFDANKPELALANLQRRLAADQAAGLDTSQDQSWIDAVKSGDKKAIAYVRGAMLANIGAIDPDRFAQNYQAASKPGSPFTRSPGQETVDPITGEVIGKTAFAPRVIPVTQPDGSTKYVEYQPGGGDLGTTAPGGGGPVSGRTRYGWTPRQRNGGDNPDNVVDNKIAGMATALGLGADDSLVGKTPMEIARALTLSEGGPGSLADRNNNPGNITDGRGGYRKFPTKEAGMAAAAAQVARNLRRGQTTIRTMVEGLPVGGAAPMPQTRSPSGTRVIAVGAAKPGSGGQVDPVADADAINNDAEAMIQNGLRMPPGSSRNQAWVMAVKNRAAQIMRERGISPQDAMRGGQDFKAAQQMISGMASTKPGTPGGITRSINVSIDHLAQLRQALVALQTGDTPIFNRISQWWQRNTGSALPTNAEALRTVVSGEINKAIIGGAGALADRQDLQGQLSTASSPAQIAGIVDSYAKLMAAQGQGIRRQYEVTTGRNDFGRYLSPRTARMLGMSPQGGETSQPVRVQSLQQARALPPGTIFIDPNGVRRKR